MKKYLLLLISLFSFSQYASACGFYPMPHEYRFWILNPGIMRDSALAPFYFGSYYTFYGSYYIPVSETVHYDENVQQWYDYLHGTVDKRAIYEAQYEIDGEAFLANRSKYMGQNNFLRLLQKPAYKKEKAYFILAKKVEAGSTYDPWLNNRYANYHEGYVESRKRDLAEAEAIYKTAGNKFLKARTAYQMIRLCLDISMYKEGKEIYEQKFLPNVDKSSWLYGAGMFYRTLLTDTFTYADYYMLSKVYDVSTNKKSAVIRRFPSAETDKILPFAKNNHERAVIYTIKEIQSKGRSLPNIEKIHHLDPGNKDLPFLIARETSKLEDWLKTPEYSGMPPATMEWNDLHLYDNLDKSKGLFAEHRKEDSIYLMQLHAFTDKIIRERHQPNIAALHICAAHQSLLAGQVTEADKHLAAIPANSPKEIQFMASMEKLLVNTVSKPYFDDVNQELYMNIIQTPDSLLPVESPGMTKDQLTLFIANQMLKKGDSARGMLMLARTERALGTNEVKGYEDVYSLLPDVGSPKLYSQINTLLYKPKKSSFENYITQKRILNPYSHYGDWNSDTLTDNRWDKNMLLDFEGMYYVNRDELEKALEVFDKIPASYWEQKRFVQNMTGDPFYVQVKKVNDPYNVLRPSGIQSMTKPEYVRSLLQLQKELPTLKGDAKALVALRIAAAYFQMSHHGEYWMMNRVWWSIHESPPQRTSFNDMYYGATKAKEWYLKAMDYATNERTAAIAAVMARHCDRLFNYYITKMNADNPYEVYYTATDAIKPLLERKYKRHPYYDMILQECR